MNDNENAAQQLGEMIQEAGGKSTLHKLVDGEGQVVHAFATASFPLRKDHWIYEKAPDGYGHPPPMPLRMGADWQIVLHVGDRSLVLDRQQMAELIRMAGKYAVRSATMHGAETDFDPDALLQNLVVGFLGYWTANGLDDEDDWANPKEEWTPSVNPPRNPGQSS